MQTRIAESFLKTPEGREAEAILRRCVHCGFCTATCPTYRLLGDERDSPRGRIYLIKQLLEAQPVGTHTRQHLDRCLLCRSCETTCPSGVRYSRLLEIGRETLDSRVARPVWQRAYRAMLRWAIPDAARFAWLLGMARCLRPVLPRPLREHVLPAKQAPAWPAPRHVRKVILPGGCAQPALDPTIDAATARVLDRLGISVIRAGGCCGAVDLHLSAREKAQARARANLAAWQAPLEAGAEAILSNASGCGLMIKEYATLLPEDAQARHIADRTLDLVELLEREDLSPLGQPGRGRRIVFHPPCTLQHGQKLAERVERLLKRLGFTLLPFADARLCCGAAGTYALTEPRIARQLRDRKLHHLLAPEPECIATANIGCQTHLAAASDVPVVHWITLLDSLI